MSAPYYRMFPREWDDGTAPLTLEQEGALLRICNAINSRGQPLPDDDAGDREMMHRCRVSMRKWKAIKSALIAAGKITVQDGKIYQDRALAEVEHRVDLAEARAENGAKGGRKRAENALKTARKSSENEGAVAKNNDLGQAYPEPEPEPDKERVLSHGDGGGLFDGQSDPPANDPAPVDQAFEAIWDRWPRPGRRRSAKPKARTAVAKAIKGAGSVDQLLAAVDRYLGTDEARKQGGQFVPGLHVWLNDQKYEHFIEEEPPPRRAAGRDPGWLGVAL